ncbi:YccF domain-containing protein [Scardovia wiggsiae]|uniref:YccF domain-containing protein n=1 Tax=Scardovia wiggsiae TaxID=230143 RepID=UPI00361AC8B4
MRLLGNILWILLGGLETAILWFLIGCILCITIIGIPFGTQCFKMAGLTLAPFGKTVINNGGLATGIFNIIWALTFGWMLGAIYVFAGLVNLCTIIGIPFGIQSFKMAALAFWPFGSEIVNID